MKIHEYQAKQLLAQYGVPIPKGGVARTAKEVRKIAEEVGGPVAIKAQIYAGGRGKAGGIKVANTPVEAEEAAKSLLGKRLITHQTGPEGLPVNAVLVEELAPTERELYVGVLIDSAESMPLMIASAAGGVDIEEVAAKSPEKILQEHIDPVTGMRPYQARKLAYGLNLAPDQIQAAIQIMTGMYKLFMEKDSSLTEINPLVVTKDGGLLALDAKVNFDDNGVPYHKDIAELHDVSQEDPLETEASKANVNYVKLDGNIGCMVNGAGLAMATMDFIKYQGGEPANFLDIGGGVTEEGIRDAFRILLSDTKVKVAWVNIFGGIVRCDLVARGIIQAVKAMKLKVPLVIRMHGTNLEEAMRLLKESGLNIILETDFTEAAKNAVAAAKA